MTSPKQWDIKIETPPHIEVERGLWVWSEVGREPRTIEHPIISADNFLDLFERESRLFFGGGGKS